MDEAAVRDFADNGFAVLRGAVDAPTLDALNLAVDHALDPALAPVEYEASVGYPGAPAADDPLGGRTPRRLLNAYSRDRVFRQQAQSQVVVDTLKQLLDSEALMLSQNHHNCIMTKSPRYSTRTAWHRDLRYWSFDRPELISVWLALGPEREENGALYVIPGSHRHKYGRGCYDANLFFREDIAENQAVLERAQAVALEAGDLLFFDALTLHCAGMNTTDQTKRSLVFTYHRADNQPIADTKSARYSDIPL